MGAIWHKIKIFLWRFFGALFLEEKGKGQSYAISLGRVVFLVVLSYLIYMWTKSLRGGEVAMPAGLMEVFYVVAGYIFGGKVVSAVRKR